MPSKKFCELIDDVCHVAKIPHAQSLYESADLDVDQIKFTLRDGSGNVDEAVAFYCQFGSLPPQVSRADALQRLLELNLAMFGVYTPVFSVNPESNHVLLMARIPMQDLSGEKLLNILAKYAAKAKEWRKTYYLTTEEKSQQQAGRRSYQNVLRKRTAA
jgi:hypothetical protein